MMVLDKSKIPKGLYCYTVIKHKGRTIQTKPCPYWSLRKDKPYQENGYCAYLGRGDWEVEGWISLLWDAVKECGINEDES